MAPLEIKGETLGQKHRHYNSLVKAAAEDETYILEEINYEDSDAANLLKVEVAMARRDAPYTLRVLRGGDALLVARALRRGAWLLADTHAHLLRPDRLHAHLFPHLNTRTKNKLLLYIRLNLRNEQRVDEFYNYYRDDFRYAQKWLYHCSTDLILSVISENAKKLNEDVINRLIKKSFVVFKALAKSMPRVVRSGNHYLYSNTDQYFELINSYEEFYIPKMGKKATRLLLQKYPETIIENFDKYCRKIDLSVLAEHLQDNQIQHFLLMQKQSNRHGLRSWVAYRYVRHFIKRLPVEDRFKFVMETFMEHDRKIILDDADSQKEDWETVVSGINLKTHYYRWYRYAPFDTAFFEIQALLKQESSAGERNSMLSVLIKCAARDLHNIQTLLQYYRKKFIREPVRYKIHFVNNLIAYTKTHGYDEITWNMLHDIYCSLDIYLNVDNGKTVSICVQSIVVYNVLHGQNIPEVIEKKITITAFNNLYRKLKPLENDKVFTYLYNYALNSLNNININSELDMVNAVNTTNEILTFIEVWNRSIVRYPALLKKIEDLIEIKKRNSSWNIDLSIFYKDHKSFRRHLFNMSLNLCPSDETCVNALKHGPDLLTRCKSEVELMCSKGTVPMQTLRKLRLFWTDTIARQLEDYFLGRLIQHIGQKSIIRGLFSLQPRENCMILIEKYAPETTKINWNEQSNSTELNIRKNIAQNMHLIRPPIGLDTVLLYAKGDYLRFTVPSLNTILQNISRTQAVPHVDTLLNTPVGLQKHGLRFVLSKLNVTELRDKLLNIWESSTNSSIKTGLFKQTYLLLCKEKEPSRIEELWEFLSILIENLPSNNKKLISNRFNKLEAIPLSVRHKFFMKSYLYLKAYPEKTADEMLNYIDRNMDMLIHLEIGFMEEVLLKAFRESVDGEVHYNGSEINMRIITAYVISSNSEEDQYLKYKTLLVPVMKRLLSLQRVRKYTELFFRDLFMRLLEHLVVDMRNLVIRKKFIIPVHLFKHIQIWILNTFSIKEEYNLITFWNIVVLFIEKLEEFSKEEIFHETVSSLIGAPAYYSMEYEPMWDQISSKMAPLFGASLMNYFKQDISSTYPTMFAFAAKSIMDIFVCLYVPYKNCYKILKYMLSDENAVTCYYIAIGVLRYMYGTAKYTNNNFELNEELDKIMLSHPSMEVRILYNQCNICNPFVSDMYSSNWCRPGFTDRRFP